jgi:hypothetical protein
MIQVGANITENWIKLGSTSINPLDLLPVLYIKNVGSSGVVAGKFVDSSGNNHIVTAGTTTNTNDSIIFAASDTTIIAALTAAGCYSTFYTNDTSPKTVPIRNIKTNWTNILFFDFFNESNLLIFSSALTGDNLIGILNIINNKQPINYIRTQDYYFSGAPNYCVLHISAYQKDANTNLFYKNIAPHSFVVNYGIDNFKFNKVSGVNFPEVITEGLFKYMNFDGTKYLKSDYTTPSNFWYTYSSSITFCYVGSLTDSITNEKQYIIETIDQTSGNHQILLWDDESGGSILKLNGVGIGPSFSGYVKDVIHNVIYTNQYSASQYYFSSSIDNGTERQVTATIAPRCYQTYFMLGADYQGNNRIKAKITDFFIIKSITGLQPFISFLTHAYWQILTGRKMLNIVCDGDSLTAFNPSWVGMMQTSIRLYKKTYADWIYNVAVGGRTLQAQVQNAPANVDAKFNTSGINFYIFFGDWVNSTSTLTKVQIYTLLKTLALDRKAVGFKVVAITPQPAYLTGAVDSMGELYETVRTYCRTQMLSEFPGLGIDLIDIYYDPYIGQPGASDNIDYYYDHLHLTTSAKIILAEYVYQYFLTNHYLDV